MSEPSQEILRLCSAWVAARAKHNATGKAREAAIDADRAAEEAVKQAHLALHRAVSKAIGEREPDEAKNIDPHGTGRSVTQ